MWVAGVAQAEGPRLPFPPPPPRPPFPPGERYAVAWASPCKGVPPQCGAQAAATAGLRFHECMNADP